MHDPHDMDKDYEQHCNSEVKRWGQKKEKVCFMWNLSCKYIQGLAQWQCPLELAQLPSNLLPEEVANKSCIKAEGSGWAWRNHSGPRETQGSWTVSWQAVPLVCPQIAVQSGIAGRWYCPPGRAFGPGEEGFLCLVFTMTGHFTGI